MKNTITINGDQHPIKFGYGAVVLLGGFLKTPGYDSTVLKVNGFLSVLSTAEKEGQGIPFEVTDGLAHLLLAGLLNADREVNLTMEEVAEHILQEPSCLKAVFELFMASMPKPKENKVPPGKRKAPARKKK